MRSIPPVARRQFDVFTTAQAEAWGLTPAALKHAVGAGELWRPRRGAYSPPIDEMDRFAAERAKALRQAVAAALLMPTTVSHAAALIAVDIPVWNAPRSCVTALPGRTGDTEGVHLHRAALRESEAVRLGNVWVTRPATSLVELARERGIEDGIVAADAVLRRRLATSADLEQALARSAGRPGIRVARRVVELADPRSESPLESVSRAYLAAMPIARPEIQVVIRTRGGRYIRRTDFYWDEFGLVGEVDGRMKYDRPDAEPLSVQKEHEDAMGDCGLGVVRWGIREIRSPALLQAKVERAIARRLRAPVERGWIAEPARWPVVPPRVAVAG